MDGTTLLRTAFADLHKEILEDTAGIADDELFWQPTPDANHIGFLLWHLVRDEDTVICQAVTGTPELWQAEGWADRFGMHDRDQGTGLETGRLATFRYPLPLLYEYADAVWTQTDAALAEMPPDRLSNDLRWSSEWRLVNLLTSGCLGHGWVHLGEIRQIRGLRGWKFRE